MSPRDLKKFEAQGGSLDSPEDLFRAEEPDPDSFTGKEMSVLKEMVREEGEIHFADMWGLWSIEELRNFRAKLEEVARQIGLGIDEKRRQNKADKDQERRTKERQAKNKRFS